MPPNIYIVMCKLFNMHSFPKNPTSFKKNLSVVSDSLRAFHRGVQVPIMEFKKSGSVVRTLILTSLELSERQWPYCKKKFHSSLFMY